MVARDNSLMGNMQSPTQPSPPPSTLCGSAFDPPSPLKSSSPPPPQSIACYLLMLSFSFPTCICVQARTVRCLFVLFLCLIFHSPSISSTHCQISTLPAVLTLVVLLLTLPQFVFSSSAFIFSHYHSKFILFSILSELKGVGRCYRIILV